MLWTGIEQELWQQHPIRALSSCAFRVLFVYITAVVIEDVFGVFFKLSAKFLVWEGKTGVAISLFDECA